MLKTKKFTTLCPFPDKNGIQGKKLVFLIHRIVKDTKLF
jgi:hypothetical protein